MLELTLSLTFAALIGMFVMLDEVSTTEFITVVLPAWMQGVGTVIAAAFAAAAYRHWRRPDDVRRRADTASAILRQSHILQVAAISARYDRARTLTRDATLEEKVTTAHSFVTEQQRKKGHELDVELQKFMIFALEASALFHEHKVAQSMKAIETRCRKIVLANRVLPQILSYFDRTDGKAEFEKSFTAMLAILGLRIQVKGDSNASAMDGPEDKDTFLDSMVDEFRELNSCLLKHLTGDKT
ncbi:MAG: hypothetical protein K2Q28_04815 [Hyphomicrobium sp.]|nr:hypothetical protein [Hyphomicrobium sp.]